MTTNRSFGSSRPCYGTSLNQLVEGSNPPESQKSSDLKKSGLCDFKMWGSGQKLRGGPSLPTSAPQTKQYYIDAYPAYDHVYYAVPYEMGTDHQEAWSVEAVDADWCPYLNRLAGKS